jgi:hypothetical protein
MFTKRLPNNPLALELLRCALLPFLDAETAQIKRLQELITARLDILATITDLNTFLEAQACGNIQRLAEYGLEIGYLATDPAIQRATCVPSEARTYIDFESLHNDPALKAAQERFARAHIALQERGVPLLLRLIPDSAQESASDNDVKEWVRLQHDEAESMRMVVDLVNKSLLDAVKLLYTCCEGQLSELRKHEAPAPPTSAATDDLKRHRRKERTFGLTIDENRRTIKRGKHTAEFEGHNLAWCILLRLIDRYDSYYETEALGHDAWEDAGQGHCADTRSLQVHLVTVRKRLKRLGLTVKYKKKIGYRLEELSKTNTKRKSTRSHKRSRAKRSQT